MTERIEGLSIGLNLDTIKVDSGLKDLKGKLKLVNSEMKANMSAFDRSDKSIGKYETSLQGLNKKLEVQKQVTDKAKTAYEKAVAVHGEGSAQADKAAKSFNEESAQLNNLTRYLGNVTNELEKMRKEQAFQESGWGKVTNKLQGFSDEMNVAGDKALANGKKLSVGLTAPIAGLGAIAVKTGIDFQAQMSKVQAISGATGNDFDSLKEKAKQLGRDTQFSASQAGEGMEYLALAGWKTNDILKGMPGMLDLAAAGNLDLGRAADITSDTMQAFGIEASKATHASDVFAYAQANANTNVEQMGEAMKYAAPVANSFKWSLEETAAAQMALADSGLKGSIAGQAFASSLARLAKPSENTSKIWKSTNSEFFTAEGRLKKMPDLVRELEKATKDMTEEQKAGYLSATFGVEAYKHWAILMERGADNLQDMTTELENSDGAAAKMAKTMNDNAAGAMKEFMSAVENLSIMASEHLLPAVTDIIKKLTKWTRGFAELSPATQKTIMLMGGLLAAMGPMNLMFGGTLKTLGALSGGMARMTGSLGRTIVGARTAGTAVNGFGRTVAGSASGSLRASNAFGRTAGTLGNVSRSAGGARVGLAALGGPMGILASVAIPALIAGSVAFVNQMKKEAMPALDSFGDKVSDATTKSVLGYKKLNDDATSQLNQLYWSGDKVTKEIAENLTGQFSAMGTQISDAMKTKFDESYKTLQTFMANSKDLTKKEQEEILKGMKEGNIKEQEELKQQEARIKQILDTASKEKRGLKRTEQREIAKIQDEMNQKSIQTMSKSELEQKTILERLKNESAKITARQAADTVKNSKKAKDGAVKEANQKYDGIVQTIIKERDETGKITKEQADTMIKSAKRQRDDTVKKAKSMNTEVVKQAKEQAKGQEHYVNWTTGEVKSHWDMLVGQTADMVNDFTGAINWVLGHIGLEKWKIDPWKAGGRAKAAKPKKHAQGTDGHPGGHAILGDGVGSNAGPELTALPNGNMFMSASQPTLYPNLPKGTQVWSARETRNILSNVPMYANGTKKKKRYMGDLGALEKYGSDQFQKHEMQKKGAEKVKEVTKDVASDIWSMTGKAMLNKGLKAVGSFIPKKDTGFTSGRMMRGAFDFLKGKAIPFLESERDTAMPFTGGIDFGGSFTKTSGFGQRWGGPHNGLDFAAPVGTPIRAQAGGKVIFSGYGQKGSGYGGYGNVVAVQGAGGLTYLYGHNSKNLVTAGANVSKGSVIGLVGSTGQSTGPHVHFEVRKNGTAINPETIIGGVGGSAAWRSSVLRAAAQMGEKVTDSQVNGILAQIQRESTGNQSIVQSPLVRDINTLSGNPAKGLLQYIPQTFKKYAMKGHGNIFNGYDQLLAFFNNTNWRKDLPYGRRGWGPTGGRKYKQGTNFVPEDGPAYLHKGEAVIPAMYNKPVPTEAMKLLALAGRDIERKNKSRNQSQSISGGGNGSHLEKIVNHLAEQVADTKEIVSLLAQLLVKDNDVILDGRSVAAVTYPHIQQFTDRERKKAQRGRG